MYQADNTRSMKQTSRGQYCLSRAIAGGAAAASPGWGRNTALLHGSRTLGLSAGSGEPPATPKSLCVLLGIKTPAETFQVDFTYHPIHAKNPIISCVQPSIYQHESCIPSTLQATQGITSPQRSPSLEQIGKINPKCSIQQSYSTSSLNTSKLRIFSKTFAKSFRLELSCSQHCARERKPGTDAQQHCGNIRTISAFQVEDKFCTYNLLKTNNNKKTQTVCVEYYANQVYGHNSILK
ncbi:uncharacterized protein ACIQIH_014501 [Cyanocitta cristata]